MIEKYFDASKHFTTLSASLVPLLFLAKNNVPAVNDPSWLVPTASFLLACAFLLAVISMLWNIDDELQPLAKKMTLTSGYFIGGTVFAVVVKITEFN